MPAIVYTDRQLLKQCGVGEIIAMGAVDPIGVVGLQHTELFVFSKAAADGTAATTTAETDLNIYFPRVGIIRNIRLTAQGASIVADPTNNATITVSKRDSLGANLTTLGTLVTTAAGLGIATLAQRSTAAFVLTAANVRVATGSTLTFSIAKGGTGVVVPISMLIIDVEWD